MQPFELFFDNHLQQAKTISAKTKKQITWLTVLRLSVFVLMYLVGPGKNSVDYWIGSKLKLASKKND